MIFIQPSKSDDTKIHCQTLIVYIQPLRQASKAESTFYYARHMSWYILKLKFASLD